MKLNEHLIKEFADYLCENAEDKLVEIYNLREEWERDGVDYVFNLDDQSDAISLLKGRMSVKEFVENYVKGNRYVRVGVNYPTPEFVDYRVLMSEMENIADELAEYALANMNLEPLKGIVTSFLTNLF